MPQLKITSNAIEVLAEHKRRLTQNIMTAILSKSYRHIPVDTGQMLKGTRMMRMDDDNIALVTPGLYAKKQYEGNLFHLIEAGAYKSISKTGMVSMDAMEKHLVKELSGSRKMRTAYSLKYKKLKDAGMLTRATPLWFHKGYEEVLKDGISRLDASAIAEARKKIRKDALFMTDVIRAGGNK